jgi:NAD(P)-dependent dehydrogenase (short-subunit alcohol dehydrogenase family)
MIDADILKVVRDGLKPGDLAVVTGCSRGFGRAISRRLASGGARLAVWDVLDDEGEETVAMCRQDGAAEVRYYHVDMGDADQVTAAVAKVVKDQGVPFGVVNNAGIHPRSKLLDTPLEMFERTLRVNLTGTFLCSREFVKHMSKAKRGSIVNLASGRGIEGAVRGAHYGASKAGILNLTRTMALEWAGFGIRVNSIIPGVSLTHQPLEGDPDVDGLIARGKDIPLGRIGHPDDIAGVVAFLLSPDSSNMTGQAMPINGGKIMLPY